MIDEINLRMGLIVRKIIAHYAAALREKKFIKENEKVLDNPFGCVILYIVE